MNTTCNLLLKVYNRRILSLAVHRQSIIKMSTIFKGEEDIHKGITVLSLTDPCCDVQEFTNKLVASLARWEHDKKRAIWFKVNLKDSHWLPVLAQHGFQIHHGFGDTVAMVKWLPKDDINRVPVYAHTLVGSGGVVLTDDNSKLLVVRERFRARPFWKLPGGYVEPKEDITEAAIREVLEETNIRTELKGLITIRHSLVANLGCSDLYFIVKLKPLNFDIIKQKEEVDEVKWMKVTEYLNHPEVHELNKMIVRKALAYDEKGIVVMKEMKPHPVTKQVQAIYSVDETSISKANV